MLIDFHTHIFHAKVAAKAIDFMSKHYRLPVPYSGLFSEVAKLATEDGFDGIVTLVAATRPNQVKSAHDWILKSLPECTPDGLHLIRFGCYHIEDPNWEKELTRLEMHKIRGIKIHPEFQGIDLADERIFPFLDAVGDRFVLLVHIGDPVVSADNRSTPAKLARLATLFPKVRFVAAHMGGYLFWDESAEYLAQCDNVWLDTSSSLEYMTSLQARDLFNAFGSDRLLLGSDYPMMTPKQALQELYVKLPGLSESEYGRICGKNAVNLLALDWGI